MLRINSIDIILILVVVVAIGCSATQDKSNPEWEKTVTLPSGEMVMDISGEWDLKVEFYGLFDWAVTIKEIHKITQEGSTFLGVIQTTSNWMKSPWKPVGSESIKGKLNEDGFREVFVNIGSKTWDGSFVWEPCEWEIIDRGNAINLDCGERAKLFYTRK